MKRVASLLLSAALTFGVGRAAAGQTPVTGGAPTTIEKVSRPMVWEPGPESTQLPLWPEGLAIQRPESDRPEEVGNGSRLVAGRPWTWATYVSRPTMTLYRPEGRRTGARSWCSRAAGTRRWPWTWRGRRSATGSRRRR